MKLQIKYGTRYSATVNEAQKFSFPYTFALETHNAIYK